MLIKIAYLYSRTLLVQLTQAIYITYRCKTPLVNMRITIYYSFLSSNVLLSLRVSFFHAFPSTWKYHCSLCFVYARSVLIPVFPCRFPTFIGDAWTVPKKAVLYLYKKTWTLWGISHILGGCRKPEGKSFWVFLRREWW